MIKEMNMNEVMDMCVELFGDVPMEVTFRDLREGTDAFFTVATIAAKLIDYIRTEEGLRKHHRAYLDVREDMLAFADEASEQIDGILREVAEKDVFPKAADHPFAPVEDDTETVSVPKEDYDCMIDDLLTMSEIIQAVAGMRTQDMKAIREFGKFVPAFAAYEKNRLSIYREAAKEAEEIFDRWADCVDEYDEDDYEPDEYFSD